PYVGSLYALSYPEGEDVSPEFWKSRLQDATQTIISALAQKAPTIFFIEDLHWADASFVGVLRHCLLEIRYPAIVLCVYRPVFSLFTSHQVSSIGKVYQEIRLQDLSPSDTLNMLGSLLKTETIPIELRRFIQEKVEGNPFYMEEVINSLIESETLIRDNGTWRLTRPIGESNVPSTVQGVISARVDRLERETKRVLQEASVIGRAFLYRILDKMTELKEHIDRCLTGLERLDLIRTRSLQPDLEYMFKHPLTQEVVYNGLLRKERQVIHEKIALVMEQLFHERLPEFYETLAFHFKRGRSVLKAVDYLMKSGEKSVKRYSVEESHQYYKEAFDILTNKPDKSREEEGLLIDLLIEWAYVFYYLGDFNALTELLSAHEDLAESLDDKANVGMFNAWLGFALFMNGKGQVAYQYVRRALELGEETGDQKVIAYAYTWLAWSSWDMGLLDEVITFGERANEIARSIRSDHYLYFKPLLAIGMTCLSRGDRKRALAVGRRMLDYGQKHSNIRSMAMGHVSIAFSHSIAGDFPSAIKSFQRAIQIKADPVYVQYPRCFLGITYLLNGQIQEAQEALEDHLAFNQEFGFHAAGLFGYAALGVVYVVKGELSRGLGMIEEAIHESVEKGRKPATCMLEHTLGNVYLQLIDSDVPFAGEKADEHLNRAVELAKEIGAKGDLSQAYLNLGLLHKAKGRTDQAKKCISNAIQLFEECDAEVYLKQAREALASLG
ncbi:MAG: hypothetical protein H8D67_00280, partial [Deltaproteobacteria bacterium]|nr:hypothetical protein [Deltaproteobacteria bacterium]